jgi:maleylpyruvate isomerase
MQPCVPENDIRHVDDAQSRFEEAIELFSDVDVARPSRLAGWKVGHVLTHVARNADSHVRRAEAAARGEVVEQYRGGHKGRTQEIELGANRRADDLITDVRVSADALRAIWLELPSTAWEGITRDVGGQERPMSALPARRWQELEVHLVDLGVGITHRDFPDEFVVAWLPRLRATAESRLPRGTRMPRPGALDDRDELAWLYGRLLRDDLPELAPWS